MKLRKKTPTVHFEPPSNSGATARFLSHHSLLSFWARSTPGPKVTANFVGIEITSMQVSYNGGTPNSRMVYNGKTENKMDDLGVSPF